MVPDSTPDPIAIAIAFGATLDRLGILYLVGGSLASSVHGEPRSTNDIDIVADLSAAQVAGFLDAFDEEFYVSEEAIRGALRAAEQRTPGDSFNLIHLHGAIKIDVFIAGADPFNVERLQRRERVQLSSAPEAHLFVDTAEHSLLRKLEWYRRGGEVSERQWRDVLAIARIQGERLDRVRLNLWAETLGVSDLLVRVLEEASGD